MGVKLGGGRRIRWRTVVGSGVLLSLVGASDLILQTVSVARRRSRWYRCVIIEQYCAVHLQSRPAVLAPVERPRQRRVTG